MFLINRSHKKKKNEFYDQENICVRDIVENQPVSLIGNEPYLTIGRSHSSRTSCNVTKRAKQGEYNRAPTRKGETGRENQDVG